MYRCRRLYLRFFFRVAVGDQCGALGDIMILSRCQNDLHGFSQAVAGYVNLRAEAAARASQRLVFRCAALSARRVLMRADDRAIQEQNAKVRILQVLHDGLKYAALAPPIEALKNGVPFAKALGQVTPRSAGLGDPHDRIDEQTIILGRRAGIAFLSWQQVLDSLPLLVRNLMASQHHRLAADGVRMVPPPWRPRSIVWPWDKERADRRQYPCAKFTETEGTSTVTKTAKTEAANYHFPRLW